MEVRLYYIRPCLVTIFPDIGLKYWPNICQVGSSNQIFIASATHGPVPSSVPSWLQEILTIFSQKLWQFRPKFDGPTKRRLVGESFHGSAKNLVSGRCCTYCDYSSHLLTVEIYNVVKTLMFTIPQITINRYRQVVSLPFPVMGGLWHCFNHTSQISHYPRDGPIIIPCLSYYYPL